MTKENAFLAACCPLDSSIENEMDKKKKENRDGENTSTDEETESGSTQPREDNCMAN